MSRDLEFPTLYQTAPHPCPYLAEQTATNLILDPNYSVDEPLYERLLENGFRRNGSLFYRPFCNSCDRCLSVRIPVETYAPNRAQRRTVKRNDDIEVRLTRPRFTDEQFSLYLKYQAIRHSGDSMDDPDPTKYQRFLVDSDVDTFFMEFRKHDTLLGIAIVDRLPHGLSAVYTYFDPLQHARSLGTLAIIKQIDLARRLGLQHVYLGYWIASCSKMSYKANFKPLEYYDTVRACWLPRKP